MSDFRDYFVEFVIPLMLPVIFVLSLFALIFSFPYINQKYEKVRIVYIGQTISTGGIGGVLQTEIKLDNGYRGFTYTDWINGVSVGDYIWMDESGNIRTKEKQ